MSKYLSNLTENNLKFARIVHECLQKCFRNGNLDSAKTIMESVKNIVPEEQEALLYPYIKAIEYIESGDEMILKRQHPEMREAILLLVQNFNEEEKL